MPGESYITGSALSKQIKKAEEGFYREADSCVPKSGNRCYHLMAWDWTQETRMQACRCARMWRDTHIEIILPFLSLAVALEKAQLEREREMRQWVWDAVIPNVCIHVMRVCVCCLSERVCLCVSGNGISVSAALYNVSQQILNQIHHWELAAVIRHTLWWLCLLQGYTAECHLEGWDGRSLPAALDQRPTHESRKSRRRGWLPGSNMTGRDHILNFVEYWYWVWSFSSNHYSRHSNTGKSGTRSKSRFMSFLRDTSLIWLVLVYHCNVGSALNHFVWHMYPLLWLTPWAASTWHFGL